MMFICCMHQFVFAQRNVELIWPSALHIGMSFAEFEQDSADLWMQGVGSAILINSGIGLRYKNRLSLMLMGGGLVNNYSFSKEGKSYDISKTASNLFLNLRYLHPVKGKGYVLIGGDIGRLFQNADELRASRNNFSAFSFAPTRATYFFTPEIGIGGRVSARSHFSISACYQHQTNREARLTTQLTDEDGTATASTVGDYLGLKIRFDYSLYGHREPKHIVFPNPSEHGIFMERATNTAATVAVRNKTVKLIIYDNGEIDNDIISVTLNGEYVLTEHILSKNKKKIKLRLKQGENSLRIHAHNEGNIPPNTLSCEMKSGFISNKLTLSSSLALNAEVKLLVK